VPDRIETPRSKLDFERSDLCAFLTVVDPREISGEVNRMMAAAINADPNWFWARPGRVRNVAFVTSTYARC